MIMYRKPQLRFFLILTAFFAIFLISSPAAQAARSVGGGRYFISSQSQVVKALFGVQHEFKNGFTADLTSGEVWTLEKIFKTDVTSVPLYKVNAAAADSITANSVAAEAVDFIQEKESARAKARNFKPASSVPWGIKKIYGDNKIKTTFGGKDVTVAVLDTGINIKHPDLVNRIVDCKDFTRGPVPRATCQDQNGHGTHAAGIIAADGSADGAGIWGVASEAKLSAYKVCRNDGTCWADDVASGLNFAALNKINIVSMSLGGGSEVALLKDAIEEAYRSGVLIIASAGNDGPAKGSIDWPAAYPEVVAVGAIDEEELVPDWSSRGVNDGDYIVENREIEFAAPGVNVESTWFDGGYRFVSGTSAATPHIAGLAAKLWAGASTSTRIILQNSARDIGVFGDDIATGLGLPVLPKIFNSPVITEEIYFQPASSEIIEEFPSN